MVSGANDRWRCSPPSCWSFARTGIAIALPAGLAVPRRRSVLPIVDAFISIVAVHAPLRMGRDQDAGERRTIAPSFATTLLEGINRCAFYSRFCSDMPSSIRPALYTQVPSQLIRLS